MSKNSNKSFNDWAHSFGRIGTVIALAYMIIMPVIVCTVFDCFPTDFASVLKGSIGIFALFVPVGIAEAISYTPILGSSCYLTFITGNIMNLKLPCVMKNARPEMYAYGAYLTEQDNNHSGIAEIIEKFML